MWWLPGATLVFFGLMIAIFPELLALMVAAAFLFVGAGWLATGYWAKKARKNARVSIYTMERHPWW